MRGVLITGDSDKAAWSEHITDYHGKDDDNRIAASVLSASHHGSRTFFKECEDDDDVYTTHLDRIDPSHVVVSAPDQADSPHGHPHDDAMQLYRGMDIGTAKLPVEQRRGIPHHQLDVLNVTETATVARYQRSAAADIESIAGRGAAPVIVGGSMLYVQSLLDDWSFPATDPAVRARWEQRLAEVGVGRLHAELARRDPEAAAAILPTDGRRTLVRLTRRAGSAIDSRARRSAEAVVAAHLGSAEAAARLSGLILELDHLLNPDGRATRPG